MAARNANWDRWAYASVAKHLSTEITSPIVFDFGGKRTAAWESSSSRGEVTIGGLRTRRITRTSHKVELDVFVIVTSDKAEKYAHVGVVGDVANALDQCILVMDYGSEVGDTGLVEVGRLGQAKDDTDFVDPTNIKPKADDDLIHSTISVTFEGTFRN